MDDHRDTLNRIKEIVSGPEGRGTSMQSVAGIMAGTVRDVYRAEQRAASAAISLAHQQQLGRMVTETEELLDLIRSASPAPARAAAPASKEPSWWFALSEAIDVLRESINRLSTLVARQKKGSPVRDLAAQTLRIFRDHYNTLLQEARTWLDN